MTANIVIMIGLACLSAVLVRLMIGVGRLDRPGPRSSHDLPTPKGGGVGVAIAFIVGSITFALTDGLAKGSLGMLAALLLAAGGLAVIAFLDDLFDWSFTVKLAAQIVAAALIVAAGFRIDAATGWLDRGVLAFLAICWLAFVTNAMNFIDGLNGLASGVALLAAVFLAMAAAPDGTILIAAPALALTAGIAGFLPFNYPKARIFMGDVGSQLCGFVIGALGLLAASSPAPPSQRILVPMVLNGVLFDVTVTLLRRLARRSRITEAHREHLYQLAQRSGLKAWMVTLIHWAMAAWGGVCALSLMPQPDLTAFAEAILAVLVPQLFWLSYVAARCRKAALPQ